jgi:hypothetical protein
MMLLRHGAKFYFFLKHFELRQLYWFVDHHNFQEKLIVEYGNSKCKTPIRLALF